MVFRDFGSMHMYDAPTQFDPLVLDCTTSGGSTDGGCCGDGNCQQSCLGRANCEGGHESPQNCPLDCPQDGSATTARRIFELTTERPQSSSLFPSLATALTHPEYHCHSTSIDWPSYDEPSTQPRWFIGRPSHELAEFFGDQAGWSSGDQLIVPGPQRTALDLGCGDGRDTRFLRGLGFRTTGVDISVPSIRRAIREEDAASAKAGLTFAESEYVLYDALQLPAPSRTIDFIFDNTIYCNLRLEYLAQVKSLLERLSHPGTLFLLNCGNANYPQVMHGHPRLKEQSIRQELGGLFEMLVVKEGVYDMQLLTTDDGTPVLEAWPELEWEVEHQGVHGWAVLMRRRGGLAAGVEAQAQEDREL